MGVIIYPCKIQDKLSKMNSELEALMGKIVTASRVMEKIHTEELSGIAWGNTKDYIASVHQPILQSYRLWGEYQKEGNDGYQNAGSMLPQVSELNQDILNNELEQWQAQRQRLYDFPLGSVLNFWGIRLCDQMIEEIQQKLEAIDEFLNTTQDLYVAAEGVMGILQQTKMNMAKISYNSETKCYELNGIDPEWFKYIQAYSKYRKKLDKIQEIYDKLNPFGENGEIDWEKADWNLWVGLLNKVHMEDLEKFNLSEEEIIAVTMILDELQGNIWEFIGEAEKRGAKVVSFLPFGKAVISILQHGGEKAIQILSKPELESKLWNFINENGEITRLLGFDYIGTEKDYYITQKGSLQSKFGFMDFYDEAGALLGMDLDDEIVTFQYGNREYRIELWKGNYGFGNAFGGEFGIYYRDISDALANPYAEDSQQSRYTLYHCLNDEEQFRTVQLIYDKNDDDKPLLENDTNIYSENNGEHFWNLSIKTEKAYTKEELYSVHRFYIEDEGMLEAATDAFKEKGIYCTIEENNGEKYLEIIWEG